MIPIKEMMGYDQAENDAMVHNLIDAADRRATLYTKNGGAQVDDGMQIQMFDEYPYSELALYVIVWMAITAIVGLIAVILISAPLWAV